MDLKWLLYTMVALLLGGETGGKCPKLTSFSGGECGGESTGAVKYAISSFCGRMKCGSVRTSGRTGDLIM